MNPAAIESQLVKSPFFLQAWVYGHNRDFLVAETFCRAAGAQLLPDPTVVDLFGTKRGRILLKAMLPRIRDGLDALTIMLRYIFRWSGPPQQLRQYSYTEKAEYWALVWGSTIMTVTGVILLLVNLIIARFPLLVFNLAGTIHFYEACLATLAILVWLDPGQTDFA